MRRLHLIEIHDQNWCPPSIRDAVTDYLRHVITISNAYGRSPSGFGVASGAPIRITWLTCVRGAADHGSACGSSLEEENLRVCLTDRYPNIGAFRRAQGTSRNICFYPDSVDARHVPRQLEGFRTLFSSFHHFKPEEARAILRDAVRQRRGIGVFEGTPRQLHIMLLMCLTAAYGFALDTVHPSVSVVAAALDLHHSHRAVVLLFDGIVSCLRTYTPAELCELPKSFPSRVSVGDRREKGRALARRYYVSDRVSGREGRFKTTVSDF